MKRLLYCDECQCKRDITVREKEETFTFRNEKFTIFRQYAECNVCHKEVSHEESDTLTLQKLQSAYEEKNNFSSNDLKQIRKNIGLPQSLFAKLIGMGVATVKRYETGGSSPDTSQLSLYKMLQNDPTSIYKFYEQSKNKFDNDELSVVKEKLNYYSKKQNNKEEWMYSFIEKTYEIQKEELNNFLFERAIESKKFLNMILFFSEKEILKAKLLKLLWYSDFLYFKKKHTPISGVPYLYLKYGPVPAQNELLLGCLTFINFIEIEEEEYEDSTKTLIHAKKKFDRKLFKQEEIDMLNYIKSRFENCKLKQINEVIKKEFDWTNIKEKQIIPYEYPTSFCE